MTIEEGQIDETSTATWFDKIDERRVAGGVKTNAQSEIVDITYLGNVAAVRMTLHFPEFKFHDFLSLLKSAQGWKIVNKIYTVSKR